MSIRRFEIERLSLDIVKPFETVVAALKAGVARLNLAEFASASKGKGTSTELESVINKEIGRTGLMLFLELDHGAVRQRNGPG